MGTPWDFQEPFCFYPWEPGTGLCTPQSPIENPEAAQRNAKCQWSDCTSTFRERERGRERGREQTREREREMEVYAGLTSMRSAMLLWGGQKWNCTHTAKGVHLRTLQKIITGWPRSLNNGSNCETECVKIWREVCQNNTNLCCFQESLRRISKIRHWLNLQF